MIQRDQKGYGGIGLLWAFDVFGRTVSLRVGPWSLTYHWRTRANLLLLEDARRDTPEKVA